MLLLCPFVLFFFSLYRICTTSLFSNYYFVTLSSTLLFNRPLHDRLTGKVMFGSDSGLTKYLSNVEEEELVQFLLDCSSVGFAKSHKQILAIILSVVHKKA